MILFCLYINYNPLSPETYIYLLPLGNPLIFSVLFFPSVLGLLIPSSQARDNKPTIQTSQAKHIQSSHSLALLEVSVHRKLSTEDNLDIPLLFFFHLHQHSVKSDTLV